MNPSYDNSFGGNDQPVILLGSTENNTSSKKNKIRIIIGVIALLILIVAGVGVGVWYGLNNNLKNDDRISVESKFNSYINYVLLGFENDDALTIETLQKAEPFFLTLTQNEIIPYVQKAEEKYIDFSTNYYAMGGDIDTSPLETYFQDYALTLSLTREDILKSYIEDGKEKTEEYIKIFYSLTDMDNYLGIYLENMQKLGLATLEMISKADSFGCIKNNSIVENCYVESEEEKNSYNALMTEALESLITLENRAATTLIDLYSEIYNVQQNEGASNA